MTGPYYTETVGNIFYLGQRAIEAGLRLHRDRELMAWVITTAKPAHDEALLVTRDINCVSHFLDGVRFADRRRESAAEHTAERTP